MNLKIAHATPIPYETGPPSGSFLFLFFMNTNLNLEGGIYDNWI